VIQRTLYHCRSISVLPSAYSAPALLAAAELIGQFLAGKATRQAINEEAEKFTLWINGAFNG